ncbi:nucleotidyltransferase family protein [Anaerocolumna sp. AGMB13020]|uniref:nucleotidyltransferase family protein n=1 Tax=Anaerocolumna sp. AGMB13020 TaxID=3081750 RepID=UPI0029548F74|nr:nucleotidyltransferase family protein [Anaerocolumna sp. AGMB13020]WOO34829.1 nucleotidyltransferase family protein [Anaerocolumna sp. AGMB13020]
MSDFFMMNLEEIAVHPEKLRRYDERIEREQEKWYDFIKPVLAELSSIPYALIKGQVLSLLAYGSTGYRDSKDIDILIARNDLSYMDEVLRKYGFDSVILDEFGNQRILSRAEKIILLNSHQVTPYTASAEPLGKVLNMDVNVDIYGSEYTGTRIDIKDFLSDTVSIGIYGQEIRTLTPVKTFISVVLHHYREMNAPYIFKVCNPLTTRMFQDVYCLFKRHLEKELEALIQYSREYDLHKYIYYMLYYTGLVFQDEALADSINRFKTPEGVALLNSYGLTEGERKIWKLDFPDRLDAPEIYSIVEPDLTERDKEKIEAVWRVI